MSPLLAIKTRSGFSYVRPEHLLAVHSNDRGACTLVLTGGLTVEAAEPAEDVVARLEAEARDEDEAQMIKESRKDGHVPR